MKTEINVQLNTSIQDLIAAHVNKTLVRKKDSLLTKPLEKIIKQEIAKLRPVKYIIPSTGATVVTNDKKHIKFDIVLALSNVSKQCMLVGPAGTGKTTLAEQVAEALGLNFASISCSAGMSEAHLTGRMLFDGAYVSAEFVDIYENGGVFLFDEIDAADPNTLLVINSAIANGYVSLVNRKDNPKAKRHENAVIIVSGNTYGQGSNMYHGRNYLDAAFLDRFAVTKVEVDYDEDLEKSFIEDAAERILVNNFWTFRYNIKEYELNRVVSTRVIVEAIKQKRAKLNIDEIYKRFFAGWSPDEIKKVREEVRL